MSDKGQRRGGAGSAPTEPASVRNVVLVGPAGSGKTTLVESLVAAAGAIPRAGTVEAGSTVSDHDEAEVRQQRSVVLSVAAVEHDGVKINLIDTPGYADFVGELRAGLRAADAALFVISAVDGVDATTSMLWEECAAVGMPRAIVVTKLDKERADFEETVAVAQRVFGEGVAPIYLPMATDDGRPGGLLGLVTMQVFETVDGTRTARPAEQEHLDLVADTRGALIEGIIAESEDETLMDRYVGGEELDPGMLVADLETAVSRGSFYPVLASATAPEGFGAQEILDGIVRACPSPPERPLPTVTRPDGGAAEPLACDPDGPLCAEVVKTTTDPYVGRVSLVRVFSGTLRPDLVVHVSGHFAPSPHQDAHADHDVDERVGSLASPLGATLSAVPHAVAGDLVAVARLSRAETGDTLSDKDSPLLVEPWVMPDPLLPVAIEAHSQADDDKLATALSRLVAEDATLRLERNQETGQLVLWCMGEAHVDVVLDRIRSRYGVAVDTTTLRVSLRETFAGPGKGHGRLVKQSGGHGQYAICDVEVQPLPPGSGFEFVDRVVGGAVPRQYIPSVEKGIRAQMEKGVGAGYPVVDLRVTLVDGKAHSVDSSDMAFQHAGGLALRDAAEQAGVSLLEPVDRVAVVVADEYVGSVMSDLSGRRGRVVGSEPAGAGRTRIEADVPALELTRYAVDLRSLSHGTAVLARSYQGHEPMPHQLATRHLTSDT